MTLNLMPHLISRLLLLLHPLCLQHPPEHHPLLFLHHRYFLLVVTTFLQAVSMTLTTCSTLTIQTLPMTMNSSPL
jgi:hypothetical protein